MLYFPRGEPGWHPDMHHRDASDLQECSVEEAAILEDEAQDQHGHTDAHPKQRQRLTSREWIAYHTHVGSLHPSLHPSLHAPMQLQMSDMT